MISLPTFSLIYSLLFLVPGFFTYKYSRHVGRITKEVDNFDKAIYTVLGSGLALSVSIVLVTIVNSIHNNELWIPNTEIELLSLAAIYIITIPISIIDGYALGHIIRWRVHEGDDIRNESVWRLIAYNSEEPTRVTVFTTDNSEIWGEIYTVDLEPHGKDLFLKYPLRIVRNDGGQVVEKIELGDYTYISEESISQIHYETDVEM
ncbi:DUF6338 family protein [Halobacteria archaeon AArc-dxtr1]|nr:DUF6338 family protein [Halobacteria archaeon AArc-dxtr1]